MILPKLAAKSLLNRKGSAFLTLFTIAFSVMLLLSIERIRLDTKSSFANTISGTGLIVGARTGDIQLLLAAVFHIGHTTNGVSWQSYQHISQQRGVAWHIPLSLGDAHQGYPVLGTTTDYFSHYQYGKKRAIQFSQGHAFARADQVVLGAKVAAQLNYQLGDKIVVAHGLGKTSFHQHSNAPLSVVGILAPTGTPIDSTLHVPLAALENMHNHNADDHHHDEHDLIGHPKQISAFLLGFSSPLYTLQVKRNIDQFKAEPLMAIMPTVTLSQLWKMLNMVEKVLLLFSLAVVIVSLLGMLTALLGSLSQRRRELAILRSVGAKPWHVFSLLSIEAVLLSGLGVLLGCGLFYLLMLLSQGWLQSHAGIVVNITAFSGYELSLLAGIIAAGWLVGVIPAAKAYFYSLSDGVSIKL